MTNLGIWTHLGEVRGDARPWLMARRKTWTTFYSRWLNVFATYYGSGFMKQNVYSSADFAGGRPLCTQILPAQGRPHRTFLASKN